MAYRMTARRARALRKAQEVSARKRRKRFGFASGRKLSRGHKRAIGAVAAGSVTVGGIYGAFKFVNRKNIATKPGDSVPDWYEGGRPQRLAKVGGVMADFEGNAGSAPSRLVDTGAKKPIQVRINPNSSETVKRIMRELQGVQVPGGSKKAKYDVVEVTSAQARAEGLKYREILFSPRSAARRERRLDRGLPDYS